VSIANTENEFHDNLLELLHNDQHHKNMQTAAQKILKESFSHDAAVQAVNSMFRFSS